VTGLALFFVAYFILDYEVRKHSKTISSLLNTLEPNEQGEGRILAVVVIGGLAVSVIFQAIGITFVLGAFFAGMLISEVVVGERLQGVLTRTLNRLNDSFFIPVFFAVSGLSVVVPTLYNLELTSVLIAITAIVGAAGSWIISRKLIDDVRPKSVVGILGGRGSVGIIIASVSLGASVISPTYFTDVVFGTVIISLIFSAMIRKTDITLLVEPQRA
jgi:Kef-type K+ transport system membrane component KefB